MPGKKDSACGPLCTAARKLEESLAALADAAAETANEIRWKRVTVDVPYPDPQQIAEVGRDAFAQVDQVVADGLDVSRVVAQKTARVAGEGYATAKSWFESASNKMPTSDQLMSVAEKLRLVRKRQPWYVEHWLLITMSLAALAMVALYAMWRWKRSLFLKCCDRLLALAVFVAVFCVATPLMITFAFGYTLVVTVFSAARPWILALRNRPHV